MVPSLGLQSNGTASSFSHFVNGEKWPNSPWSHLPRSLNPDHQKVPLSFLSLVCVNPRLLLESLSKWERLQKTQSLCCYQITTFSVPFLVFVSNSLKLDILTLFLWAFTMLLLLLASREIIVGCREQSRGPTTKWRGHTTPLLTRQTETYARLHGRAGIFVK